MGDIHPATGRNPAAFLKKTGKLENYDYDKRSIFAATRAMLCDRMDVNGPHLQANEWYLGRVGVSCLGACLLLFLAGLLPVVHPAPEVCAPWIQRGLGVLLLFGGFALFIRQQIVVDPEALIVRQHGRFFGLIPLWSRRFPFSDFASVVVRYVDYDDGPYCCFVFLQRLSGRQLFIKKFRAARSRVCQPAEELARGISSKMQIGIDVRNA